MWYENFGKGSIKDLNEREREREREEREREREREREKEIRLSPMTKASLHTENSKWIVTTQYIIKMFDF